MNDMINEIHQPLAVLGFTLCRQCFEGVAAKPGQPGYREWARAHVCVTPLQCSDRTHTVLARLLATAPMPPSC